MRKLTAESIIKTYTTLVNERGGIPLGERVFTRETGISRYHWMGGHWRSWSAFQEAAGYSPNNPTQKIPDEILLRRFAQLALEGDDVPTEADLNLKRKLSSVRARRSSHPSSSSSDKGPGAVPITDSILFASAASCTCFGRGSITKSAG